MGFRRRSRRSSSRPERRSHAGRARRRDVQHESQTSRPRHHLQPQKLRPEVGTQDQERDGR